MKVPVFTAVLAALIAHAGLAQPIDSRESLNNRAFTASPRAKELFPELPRSGGDAAKKSAAFVRGQRQFATSPRELEQVPELTRPPQIRERVVDHAGWAALQNRAYSASPRAIEEFPWLARVKQTPKEVQIAPLK